MKTMIKTTFGAAAIAAATVLAMGSVSSTARADGPSVGAASGGACKAGGECVVLVTVTVSDGSTHVNTEYNHKVTMGDAAGVTFLGKSKPALFSRDDGDFTTKGDKVGQVTVHFKPTAKGKVTLAGTYKYATCKEGGGGCTPGSAPFSVAVDIK
jgi:hypothetical protein